MNIDGSLKIIKEIETTNKDCKFSIAKYNRFNEKSLILVKDFGSFAYRYF